MTKLSTPVIAVAILTFGLSQLGRAQNWPYNPDANNDQWIGTHDLTAFLSVFDSSFTVHPDASGSYAMSMHYAGEKPYIECAGYCRTIGGKIPNPSEFGMFVDSPGMSLLLETGGSSSSSSQTTTRAQQAWCGDWTTDLYMPYFGREMTYFYESDSLVQSGIWGLDRTPITGYIYSPALTSSKSCLCVGIIQISE